ncbi:2'-5' RNA ligase family protein [Pseudalkalibacillus caeni]|uniref:2'-5' RNA ligase family protein n=1 Tax=Exobacillus caeni TaxID=2574798 RepID=A0A5R9F591_9BACL|nr:2'-5' RNA ligase family protein [Pseudalkalibacillus caeni]TLS38201.1 2'-5' RNA ligase family protein [Pseudalkalibacillus caeni]
MPVRTVCLFPDFKNRERIDELREKYDPLFGKIPPHITLVFPFESEWTAAEVENHVKQKLKHIKPFTVRLRGISGSEGEYLFLNVKKGNDEIIAMHDALYTGMLQEDLNRQLSYHPHLTVGRFNNENELMGALEETEDFLHFFEAEISCVLVERIGPNEKSIVESCISLKEEK